MALKTAWFMEKKFRRILTTDDKADENTYNADGDVNDLDPFCDSDE